MLKIKGLSVDDINGFIDEGTEFLGELRFRNAFRVDGRVKGRVISENALIVGETGDIEAEIDCGVVSIRGRVKGTVRGRQRIELLSGARVSGTLSTPVLSIEEGSLFEGDCQMRHEATPLASPGATPSSTPDQQEDAPSSGTTAVKGL
jgi:cytoskeletal protein CcmA (bactofilin family)